MPFPSSPPPGTDPAANPYDTAVPLWLYRARGVHVEDGGHHVQGGVELFATSDEHARSRAAGLFRGGVTEVERLPLPAVTPPGFGDDAIRLGWSAARQAYHDERNAAFRARLAEREMPLEAVA